MNKLCYLIIFLSVALFCSVRVLMTYQDAIPRLVWANETLYLNVVANRQGWKVCKRFGICDQASGGERVAMQEWDVVRIGEAHFRP